MNHGTKDKRKRQRYILQGLPGIGSARAERLLNTFGTVQGVCHANPDQWAEVPGIGRRTAEAMERVIREVRMTYADGNQGPDL